MEILFNLIYSDFGKFNHTTISGISHIKHPHVIKYGLNVTSHIVLWNALACGGKINVLLTLTNVMHQNVRNWKIYCCSKTVLA